MRPLLYEFTATVFSFGRRKAAYDRLAELCEAETGEKVLDVGCGTGYLTRRLKAAVGPGGAVTGVDPSRPMLEYAVRHVPTCYFQEASAQALPFAEGSFDLVASSLAIHHVPPGQQPEAFRELRRVLRPGGRVVIMELHGSSHGHAVDDLPGQLEAAGFTVTDDAPIQRRLRCVRAQAV
ncbi:class I SAM-dependent methyltransferase [Kribbella deserti]|uniref:Class I SAM-dependent methyltransferase n=1 Tax=Kribbella deserti TaxID=1926257 RepID=A0ABV6QMJ2_9ACTN